MITIPENAVLPNPNPFHRGIQEEQSLPLRKQKLCLGVVTMLIIDFIIIAGIVCVLFMRQPSKSDHKQSDWLPNLPRYVASNERYLDNTEGDGLPSLANEEIVGLSSVQSLTTGADPHKNREDDPQGTTLNKDLEAESSAEGEPEQPMDRLPDSGVAVDSADCDPFMTPFDQITLDQEIDTLIASDSDAMDVGHKVNNADQKSTGMVKHPLQEKETDEEEIPMETEADPDIR